MKQINDIWIPDDTTRLESLGYIRNKPQLFQQKFVKTIQWHLPIGKLTKTAIDIGANIGTTTKLFCDTFSNVVAFESDPSYVECFAKNMELTGGWTLYTMPLEKMYPLELHGLAQDVMVDDFDIQDVSLIKCDIPSNAEHVISGASETILLNKPLVVLNDSAAINYCQTVLSMAYLSEFEGYTFLGWNK